MTTNEQLTMLTQNALALADKIWLIDGFDSSVSEISELRDVLSSMRQLLNTADRPMVRFSVATSITLNGVYDVDAPSSAMAEEYIKAYVDRYITHLLWRLSIQDIKACASRN